MCRSDAEAHRSRTWARLALRCRGAASSSHDALGLDLQLAVEVEQVMSDDARRSSLRSPSSEGFAPTLSSDSARCNLPP